MKAAYYTGNKTFAIESVQPVAPGEGEVQVGVAWDGGNHAFYRNVSFDN